MIDINQICSESEAAQPLKAALQAWIEKNNLEEGTQWSIRWKRRPPRIQPDLKLSFFGDLRNVIWCLPFNDDDPGACSRLRYEFDEIVEGYGFIFKIVTNLTGHFYQRGAEPRHRRKPNLTANKVDPLVFELPNEVQLTVCNTSGHLTIRQIENFLAEAMTYLKHQAARLEGSLFSGPYCATAMYRRDVLGKMRLSCPKQEGLTAALWTQTVIAAYTRANTVKQMLDALPEWQKAVERDPGYVQKVVGLLDKPGGDLLALDVMLKRPQRL